MVAERHRETREAECAPAQNQDCAADFCLARQISGGWKIIWSWLWEVVGSGRCVGDVGGEGLRGDWLVGGGGGFDRLAVVKTCLTLHSFPVNVVRTAGC